MGGILLNSNESLQEADCFVQMGSWSIARWSWCRGVWSRRARGLWKPWSAVQGVVPPAFHPMFWFKASGFDFTFCLVELKPWDSRTDETAWECAWSSRTATIRCSGIKPCASAPTVSRSHGIEECEPFGLFFPSPNPQPPVLSTFGSHLSNFIHLLWTRWLCS